MSWFQQQRYDFSWRRTSLRAVLFACLAGGVTLACMGLCNRSYLGHDFPTDNQKVLLAAEKIDPSTASAASLRRLPGLGPVKAQAIVDYRAKHGPKAFASINDLEKVPGLGPVTAARMAPFLCIKGL